MKEIMDIKRQEYLSMYMNEMVVNIVIKDIKQTLLINQLTHPLLKTKPQCGHQTPCMQDSVPRPDILKTRLDRLNLSGYKPILINLSYTGTPILCFTEHVLCYCCL